MVAALDDLEVVADAHDSADRQRPGAVVEFAPVASDNFDPDPPVACKPASGSFFGLGTTAVSCAARDASGNPSAAVTFSVTVVQPPPSTADVDLAYDPDRDRVRVTETHGGDDHLDRPPHASLPRSTIMKRASTCAAPTTSPTSTTWTAACGLQYLRYDGGKRLRPTSNGYAFSSSERHDGSLKRLVIAVRAGRNAVIVKYSAGSDQSLVRYIDLSKGTTLRVVRIDGLVIPHLRSDAGRMLIDVGSGS